MVKAFELFYIDDHGEEHELGTFIEESMEDEKLRARMRTWISKMHGDAEARKWDYFGPQYREV